MVSFFWVFSGVCFELVYSDLRFFLYYLKQSSTCFALFKLFVWLSEPVIFICEPFVLIPGLFKRFSCLFSHACLNDHTTMFVLRRDVSL